MSDFNNCLHDWKRLARMSVGDPRVGIGVEKALLNPWLLSAPPSPLILPALRLRRLLLLLRLPVRFMLFFFFSVWFRDGADGWTAVEAVEVDRCSRAASPSPKIEDPR